MPNLLAPCLKSLPIAAVLACVSQLAQGYGSPPPPLPLTGVENYLYKVGDPGPGGGFIFFVDYFDQYPGFTYLEAAATDAGSSVFWCLGKGTHSLVIPADGTATGDWAARGVEKGHANTAVMLENCTAGAAHSAANYLSAPVKTDWFLPSASELELMYTNLQRAGVGGFAKTDYWSSTESDSGTALVENFAKGYQDQIAKHQMASVRAIRAF